MNPNKLKYMLAAVVIPLVVTACFSSTPVRSGGEDSSSSDGSESGGSESSSSGSSSGSSSSSSSSSSGSNSGSQTGSNSGATPPRGHQGVPGTPRTGTGALELPTPGAEGQGDRNSSSDIRVATANSSRDARNAADSADSATKDSAESGSPAGQSQVSVAEALEGANAAVDAAAGAVAEAEATIARAKEDAAAETEAQASGGGEEDNFDPWAQPGSDTASERATTENGQPDAGQKAENKKSGSQQAEETEDDSFDPFATYSDEQKKSANRIPRRNSLETADHAVDAARAALNRARRSLINAASSGDGDADAEAVQLSAARAAMEAAAEAVIASAIAVMAASDAFADDAEYDAEAAEAAQETMARGIEMVVDITRRDMSNAAEALEATGELLAAAGSLIGMLGGVEEPENQNEDRELAGSKRVASLEKQLDRSLSVFDDRMETEGRGVGGAVITEDSETASLTMPDGARVGQQNSAGSQSNSGGDNDSVGEDKVFNPDIKARYEQPERMGGTEVNDYKIEEARAQDDDIVARQLREAAMAETDPELREALWREYKNYKESLESGEAEANQ